MIKTQYFCKGSQQVQLHQTEKTTLKWHPVMEINMMVPKHFKTELT